MTTPMNWNAFLVPKPPWYHLVTDSPARITDVCQKKLKYCCRIVRGKKMNSKELLLQEFGAALQFPYYFGENWDGFNECLADLSWLDPSVVILCTDAEQILPGADPEFGTFLKMLDAAAHDRNKNATSLHFLFQVASAAKEKFSARCAANAIQLAEAAFTS